MNNDQPLDPAVSPAAHLLAQAMEEDDDYMDSAEADEPPGDPRTELLKEQIRAVISTVYDPEIPVNIYELGLIYQINVDVEGRAHIVMTLTSPACPVAGTLPVEVENKVASVPGVTDVEVELVWDPPFSIEMMSEAARLQLGLL